MSDEQFPGAGMQTLGIHASERANSTHAVSPPIWQTSTFRADSPEEFAHMSVTPKPGQMYTRYGNPTHEQVEASLCALERGEAALMSSSG
ncbi:MAG TPA: PLP-dependent transferase, partial [Chloroflexia bacterium]|nr:PLP-dependent transferase [Chloroflexia bacterium]